MWRGGGGLFMSDRRSSSCILRFVGRSAYVRQAWQEVRLGARNTRKNDWFLTGGAMPQQGSLPYYMYFRATIGIFFCTHDRVTGSLDEW